MIIDHSNFNMKPTKSVHEMHNQTETARTRHYISHTHLFSKLLI